MPSIHSLRAAPVVQINFAKSDNLEAMRAAKIKQGAFALLQVRDTVRISKKGATLAKAFTKITAPQADKAQRGNIGLTPGLDGAAPASTPAANKPASPVTTEMSSKADAVSAPAQAKKNEAVPVDTGVSNDKKEEANVAVNASEQAKKNEAVPVDTGVSNDTKEEAKVAVSLPAQVNKNKAVSVKKVVSNDKKEDVNVAGNPGNGLVNKDENAAKQAEKAAVNAEDTIQGPYAKIEKEADQLEDFMQGIRDKMAAFRAAIQFNQMAFGGMNGKGFGAKSGGAFVHMSGMETQGSSRLGMNAMDMNLRLADNAVTPASRTKAALTYFNRYLSEMDNTGMGNADSDEQKTGDPSESIV